MLPFSSALIRLREAGGGGGREKMGGLNVLGVLKVGGRPPGKMGK